MKYTHSKVVNTWYIYKIILSFNNDIFFFQLWLIDTSENYNFYGHDYFFPDLKNFSSCNLILQIKKSAALN